MLPPQRWLLSACPDTALMQQVASKSGQTCCHLGQVAPDALWHLLGAIIRDAKHLQATGAACQGHQTLATLMSRWFCAFVQVVLQAAVGEQRQAH